jgi:hypothetical protein
MKTLKKVTIEPVFVDGYMPDFENMDDNKIYISEKYNTSAHKCLCGCGTKTILPLNHDGSNYGWNLIKEHDGTVSFTPSILNPITCISETVDSTDEFVPPSWTKVYASHHYIITKNIANFC